jgi:hypothetical protein
MTDNDAQKLSLELIKAALAAGWQNNRTDGDVMGLNVAKAHEAIVAGIMAIANK